MHLYFLEHILFSLKARDQGKHETFKGLGTIFGWRFLTFVLPYNIISANTAISLILDHI